MAYSAYLLVALVLVASAVGEDTCGNTGEDYYSMDKGYIRYNYNMTMDYPYWIFNNNTNATCQFTRVDCKRAGECTYFGGTYEYQCTVVNPTVVSGIVSAITNMTYGPALDQGANCGCLWPSIPEGKYVNGYTLTIPGKSSPGIDSTYTLLTSCNVKLSFQDSPLKEGDVFTQKFVLDDNHGKLYALKVAGITVLVVAFVGIIGGVGFCMYRRRQKKQNSPYGNVGNSA